MEAASRMEIAHSPPNIRATRWAWILAIVSIFMWSAFIYGSASVTRSIFEILDEAVDYRMPLIAMGFLKWGGFCQSQGLILMLIPPVLAGLGRELPPDPERRRSWLLAWAALLAVSILGGILSLVMAVTMSASE